VRPRMTHTLTRKGMTKSEARDTLESLCYLRVVVRPRVTHTLTRKGMTKSEARVFALYLFLATTFALRYSASGRDTPRRRKEHDAHIGGRRVSVNVHPYAVHLNLTAGLDADWGTRWHDP
ncbi:hypothetical protein Taro_052084, partial [Colocasia esculenta]|nr:hypothetical protein [Colocasia esculenta]